MPSKSQKTWPFIEACYQRPTPFTPVWLMRQAGRYQPSYRSLRKDTPFFDLCRTPELASQVTLKAVDEFGVDAAIIFSDILVPLIAMGAHVELTERGPKVVEPVVTQSDVDRLRVVEPAEAMPFVMDAIGLTKAGLEDRVPLIGFAGGPITLASYLIAESQSVNLAKLKQLFFSDPGVAHALLEKLSDMVSAHLRAQVEAGCDAIQLFDSWAGALTPADFGEFCLPYVKQIFESLADLNVPRIYFSTCAAGLVPQIKTLDIEVISVDWRLSLADARTGLGERFALQGNLDPCCLFLPEDKLRARIAAVFEDAGDGPGHIFNLGHGVLPPTQPERVRFMVDTVHQISSRRG